MAKFKLPETFITMAEGRKSLKVISAEAKPAAKPVELSIKFMDASKAKLNNRYTLDEKNEKGMRVTALFLKACLGDIDEFDTDNVDMLVGKFIDAEIVHNDVPNRNDPTKVMTFANITRIYGAGVPFETSAPQTNNRPKL